MEAAAVAAGEDLLQATDCLSDHDEVDLKAVMMVVDPQVMLTAMLKPVRDVGCLKGESDGFSHLSGTQGCVDG